MATATLATAAGAAALYYYTKWGTPWRSRGDDELDDSSAASSSDPASSNGLKRRLNMPRLVRAPSTWFEALATLMETLRFTYSETLGKWPIGDLAFGINYLLKRQGHLHVASVYAGDGCQLKGPEVVAELKELLRLLSICMHFSKKPFPQFLEATGYTQDQVFIQEAKAALLKPAFVVLLDEGSGSILLVIRGTHSIKDTLTAVTGAVVPFHHTLLDNGGVQSLVLGYAHCGMVAAARWIAQVASPHLLGALEKYPSYQLKIVGHSLGGGTAALLTYILRERKEFAAARCVSFAPAACMTRELAESGTPFVTSVVNGSDLVPTFSPASVDDLRAEVTASAWISDFKEQIERTRILRTVFRSATVVSSKLSSIARVRSGVANAGIWRPVSSGTQACIFFGQSIPNFILPWTSRIRVYCTLVTNLVVMKQAQNVAMAVARTRPSLAVWGCMGPRQQAMKRAATEVSSTEAEAQTAEAVEEILNTVEAEQLPTSDEELDAAYASEGAQQGVGEQQHGIGEEFLWHELEMELNRHKEESDAAGREEEEKAAREITREEEDVMATASEMGRDIVKPSSEEGPDGNTDLRFYPPGRLIHMVSPLPDTSGSMDTEEDEEGMRTSATSFRPTVGLFETNRELYGKIRLSRTMVNDHYMPIYKKTMEELIGELERQLEADAMAVEVEAVQAEL